VVVSAAPDGESCSLLGVDMHSDGNGQKSLHAMYSGCGGKPFQVCEGGVVAARVTQMACSNSNSSYKRGCSRTVGPAAATARSRQTHLVRFLAIVFCRIVTIAPSLTKSNQQVDH
jgi:hypothetical protein